MGQSLTDWQRPAVTLQWPRLGQDPVLTVPQAAPLTLQAPGCGTQTAAAFAAVQLVPTRRLQWPGSSVHTGGAQVVTGVHGFSGSGGSRLQPGGLYVTRHTCGW